MSLGVFVLGVDGGGFLVGAGFLGRADFVQSVFMVEMESASSNFGPASSKPA